MELTTSTIIIALATIISSLLTFAFAVKKEIRKNFQEVLQERLHDEKRHYSQEQRLALLEERYSQTQHLIGMRLDEIRESVNEFRERFIKHIEEAH